MKQMLDEVRQMRLDGLGHEQIARLLYLKHRVASGRLSELTPEFKRQLFYRGLYVSGRLNDGELVDNITNAA